MANNFVNRLTQSLAASLVPVYTADRANLLSSTILGCSIANTSTSPITVDVGIQAPSPSTVTTYLVKQATVPVGGALIVIGAEQKVVLSINQRIVVFPSTAMSCDVAVSALEITP